MPENPKVPVIVGIGEVINRSKEVKDAIEPLQLMILAIQNAVKDTAIPPTQMAALQSQIDSIDVVRSWTWPADYPSLISEKLAIRPQHTHYPDFHSGDQPTKLLDFAAQRISRGLSRLAVVTGGEALASLSACAAAKRFPPPNWTPPNEEVKSVFSPTARELKQNLGARHGIGAPIHVYPLFENGFRAHRIQPIRDNHAESASMYADFSKIAERHPSSWYQSASSEDDIATVSSKNRMISFPYPLLMNAFNTVNLSAAVILTSTEHAKRLGIPADKWIYPLGGAGTSDSNDFWKRPNFWWSPAISRSIDSALEISGLCKDDIDLWDFYSCFPIVPKLACKHLGLSITSPAKPISLLGGLTSFGGAGNNYSLHATIEMVRQLRKQQGKYGLVLANGGLITYEYALCMSRSPRRDGLPYPDSNPLPKYVTDVQVPQIAETADGDATVETYTVEFGRDGQPSRGFVIGRLKSNGHRFVANHADELTLNQLSSWDTEPVGRSGFVRTGSDGRSLFSFEDQARL